MVPPSGVHLVKGAQGLVVAITVKSAAGKLVKTNWNEPSSNLLAAVKLMGATEGLVESGHKTRVGLYASLVVPLPSWP